VRFLFIVLSILVYSFGLWAQSPKAIKDLNEAVLWYEGGQTEKATSCIQQLIEKFPEWTAPRHELSRIYYETGQKQKSINILEEAIRMDSFSQQRQLLTLARLYEETGHIDRAIAGYKSIVMMPSAETSLVEKAQQQCQALKARRNLFEPSYVITPRPFPDNINTPDHEALGRWTLDGKSMIFTRFQHGQEDIWMAQYDSVHQSWQVNEFPYNSELSEGGHAISPDGKTLVFTACNRRNGFGGCDLYWSQWKNNGWSSPVNMGATLNSSAYEGQPSFGPEGRILYFSSNRTGGEGGRDIWFAVLQSPGNWSVPQNIKAPVNTSANEESPFIHFDGMTLYFMRDGQEGLGGYDIYIARRELDLQWNTPENLGVPINTTDHEGALSLHPDGQNAIITRMTVNQRNDLFEIELPEKFRAIPQQALQVIITDKDSGMPVKAFLEIYVIEGDTSIRQSQWTDQEGRITTHLRQQTGYGILANASGYISHSSNIMTDTSAVRILKIQLIPVMKVEPEPIVLENIFFKSGSSEILPASEPELSRWIKTLLEFPEITIEIRGHTDDVGEMEYNQQLSEARAKAVYDYLGQRGIAPERLAYKGFGEARPIADNQTEEGRRKNRRTEFIVIRSK
jgi:outer membrane protein OmpA-like peptidoglycan-associated protein